MVLVFIACTTGLAMAGAPVTAQEPRETATSVTQPAPDTIELHDDGLGAYSWDAVPGAAEYHLRVELTIVRANPVNPFCAPPVQPQSETLTADEILPATETSFAFVLPAIPPEDAWYRSTESIALTALGAEGETLAGVLRGGVSETRCAGLSEPLAFAGCTIPAGWAEVTTPPAVERGQRVFESPDASSRTYVFAGGSCIHLALGEGPAPEFAPDPITATDGASGLRPPDTGHGSGSSGLSPMLGAPLLLSGLVLAGAGVAMKRVPAGS